MKGGNFVSFAFAARQTERQVFSCSVVFTVTVFLFEFSTFVAEAISAQTGVSCIARIFAALYWYFMSKRRTCNKRYQLFYELIQFFLHHRCFSSQWYTVTVHQSSSTAIACQKIFTWLSLFDHVVMKDLNNETLIMRTHNEFSWHPNTFTTCFVKPVKNRIIQLFYERLSSSFFATLSLASFCFLIRNRFFNTFFFSWNSCILFQSLLNLLYTALFRWTSSKEIAVSFNSWG